MHAWIEVDGHPVGEADDITDYTPFEEAYERHGSPRPVG
jgi:hypothetical protein